MAQLGFYMDAQACYGCQTCEIACKLQNDLPVGVRWRQVRIIATEAPKSLTTLSMACNHCTDPQCLKVCPVGAYTKRADGVVVQDHALCIGCRMCVMACPYGAPQYNAQEGKVSKCDFCASRLAQGLQPRCVEACPAKALQFGDLDELRKQYGTVDELRQTPPARITQPSIVIKPTAATQI